MLPFLPALQEIFSLPCSISCTRDMEKVSFENMQLSTQGAERQRKDILKTALRFEQLLVERRRTSSDMNDSEILAELVTKYNQYRANAAIKKWQVSADGHQAIWAIIIGLDEISRSLIKQHLDHNKWEESGVFSQFCFCFCVWGRSRVQMGSRGVWSLFSVYLGNEDTMKHC